LQSETLKIAKADNYDSENQLSFGKTNLKEDFYSKSLKNRFQNLYIVYGRGLDNRAIK